MTSSSRSTHKHHIIIHVTFKKTLRHILQDYEAFPEDVEGINSEAFLGTKAYNAQQNRLWVDLVACVDSRDVNGNSYSKVSSSEMSSVSDVFHTGW